MKKALLAKLIKRSFVEMMKDVGTSIPGHIIAYDDTTGLAQVQIGIVRTQVGGKTFEPTPLVDVLVYVAGGDFFVESEINPGDEGVILFSQRCIDAWVQTGGVAENPIMRFHDFSDAYFLPGLRSKSNQITGFKNDGIRMRNKDGTRSVWLKKSGAVEVNAVSFNINTTDPIGLTHNGVNISGKHTHTSAKPGDPTTPPSGVAP